ncbi:hypothetical protein JKP88DRAFT_254047 [Tribonema minus]|uniref:Uncharacterized protein n=1 Tax=Tribonema minus TaxID=303371 RepID=A0A835Z6U3_9STRA|nr:hypothetical protein JKP88DRAFT_254047 [Tribonema minus]
MLGGGARGNRQSSLVPFSEEREPQAPATTTAGGSGGGICLTKAVTRPVGEALTAGDAGGSDGDCSGDDHSIHSLDVDANHDSVGQEVAENSSHESETNTDAGGACSAGSDASDSTYVCSDSGERFTGMCEERVVADDSSDADSYARGSDSSSNFKPIRKCARIAGVASSNPRRRAAAASDALRSRAFSTGDAAGTGKTKGKGSAKRPRPKQQRKL